ncbi:MAG: translation initiation factor IF-6 [Thaumarchaeota archaeon]|nr:MAG: translation initiation factor IF-6 [Nitrososphaerota archaeon]TLX90439.1 MAG: translation initiation factor IF-6 [Nitrososphaerota archaeon]
MVIYKYDVYRSPNVGLFVRTNNDTLLLPFGFAETKAKKLKEYLYVEKIIHVSIAGTRLIGPMTVMNNNGILLPYTVSDDEIRILKQTGLNVDRVKSKFTAIGNLISANDKGAVVSNLFKGEADQNIKDILGVPIQTFSIGGYVQVGSMIVTTNAGAIVHPIANDWEISRISEILQVEAEPATVNGGSPFLSSGILANFSSVIVGNLTTGPELIMISRALKV